MSNETGHLNRRSFLKGIVALGAVAALPGGLLTSRCALAQPPVPFNPKTYKIYRNACPRNCYDTCSLKTWVKDGVITFVEGAPESTFTHGTPCVKGLSYPRRVYSPDRIKYPMAQDVRGSGNWRRISWEEAMQRIAAKMLEIKKKDGSMLGLALTKYSGKFGVLNYAVEGMMSSLGYTTRFAGTPCWPAGIDAQNYDMGDMWCNDPEDMVKAKYIIIWGANPAWCSMHSMKYIYQAREKGAKVVVIDPLLSQTAAKADLYLRVRPGSDGALALGMARHLVDKGLVDQDFVNNDAHGYPEFEAYLRNNVTVEWAAEICGLSADVIRQLAEEFTAVKPATVWIGYGMQRHVNGGANVRAIDAFVAMSGNIGVEGGGARYGHLHTWGFNYNAMLQKPPVGAIGIPGAAGTTSEFGAAAGSDAVDAIIAGGGMVGGLGERYTRVAAAHAVHNGLTVLPQTEKFLHGTKVAYGILVQSALLGQDDVLAQLITAYRRFHLPARLSELDVDIHNTAEIDRVIAHTLRPVESIHYLPVTLTPDTLRAAFEKVEFFRI